MVMGLVSVKKGLMRKCSGILAAYMLKFMTRKLLLVNFVN